MQYCKGKENRESFCLRWCLSRREIVVEVRLFNVFIVRRDGIPNVLLIDKNIGNIELGI